MIRAEHKLAASQEAPPPPAVEPAPEPIAAAPVQPAPKAAAPS
jgi:hypothetical protein